MCVCLFFWGVLTLQLNQSVWGGQDPRIKHCLWDACGVVGNLASLLRGGVRPTLFPAWPRFRPPAPLGSLSRSREKPPLPEAPSPPLHKPFIKAAPRPSSPAHSPQLPSPHGTLPVPFMSPPQGDLPLQPRRQLLVSQPLKHGCRLSPPPRGARGKGQRCHLPGVLNGASGRP